MRARIVPHLVLATALALGLGLASTAAAGKKDKERQRIVVEMDDDRLVVTSDGKVSTPLRVRQRDGRLVILDEDGESVLFELPESLNDLGGLTTPVGPQGPRIGVRIEAVAPALAAQLGLAPGKGVTVVEVLKGGPAARGGMQRYDIIAQIDGRPVEAVSDVQDALSELDEGRPLAFEVLRAGRLVTLKLVPTWDPIEGSERHDLGLMAIPPAVRFLGDDIAVLHRDKARTRSEELEHKLRRMEERLRELEERLEDPATPTP